MRGCGCRFCRELIWKSPSQVSPQQVTANNDPADLVTIHALHCCSGKFREDKGNIWVIRDDSGSLAKANECRQQLLEAGADPTISTPNTRSPARVIFSSSRKVIRDCFHSEQCSDCDKDALATLLNHGLEFLVSEVDPREVMAWYTAEGGWTLEGVGLLLQLNGSKLPVQNLTHALWNAIHGSLNAYESEWLQVLVLLIENGAEVTGNGHLVSKLACNPRTSYSEEDMRWNEIAMEGRSSTLNQDLRLRRIWAKALAACGYDAEEFISKSTCFEELSETNDEGSEDNSGTTSDEDDISTAQYIPRSPHFEELSEIDDERRKGHDRAVSNEDDISTAGYISQSTRFEGICDTDDEGCEDSNGTISDEIDTSTAEDPSQPPKLNEEAFDGTSGSGPDDTSQLSGPIPYSSSDWALLEEDALIWQD